MKITAQQYISKEKGLNSFVTAYTNLFSTRSDRSLKEGDVYILIQLSSEKQVPLDRISKFVLDSIADGYIYSPAKTTNDSVKEALNDGVSKLRNLVQSDKDLKEVGIDMNILMTLVRKEGLYVGFFGEGEIYVSKGEKVINIFEVMKGKNATTAGIVLEDNESLLLSTAGILSKNIVDITVGSKKTSLLREISRIGVNLTGSAGILYFENTDKKETVLLDEKPKIVNTFVPEGERDTKSLNLKGIKKAILKPLVAVSSFFKRIKEKVNVRVKIPKNVKSVLLKISLPIKMFFVNLFLLLKRLFLLLWEKVCSLFATKRWFKKISSRYSEVRLGRRRPVATAGMRIDDYKIKNLRGRRIKMVLGIVAVVLLLIFGINFTINSKKGRERSRDANEKFTRIETLLNKTDSNLQADRASAETSYFEAGNILKEIPTELNEKDGTKRAEIEKRYQGVGDLLYKKVGVSESAGNASKFLDTKIFMSGEGSSPTDIDIYRDKSNKEYLIISDSGKKVVYSVFVGDKNSQKVIPDDDKLLKSPANIAAGEQGILVYDKDVGVLKSTYGEDGTFSKFAPLSSLSSKDIKSKDIVDMMVLSDNDNVYLLARDLKAVLKSTALYGDRYSMLSSYVTDPRFEKGADIMGDFSIYVAGAFNESVLRYSYSYTEDRQIEAALGITGITGDLGEITKAYSSAESLDTGLYLFDSKGKRFMKFEKPNESVRELRHPRELLLLKQYEYRGEAGEDFSNVKDFVVDFKEENMYVLDGTTVWKISL